MVPPYSDRITRVPPYSISLKDSFRVRGYHPLSPDFPDCSTSADRSAGPLSLAATKGISVDFFSSGYLDVSVLRVCLYKLCIHLQISSLHWMGFPIRKSWDIALVCQLPQAYRRLQRPSSPPTAKASTICAYSLDHITPSGLEVISWFYECNIP